MRLAIISMSLPPKKMAMAAPMKPDIERRPKEPVSQLYGATVKVREEVSWTTMFHPTNVPTVKPGFVSLS
jgi:hypothetical protein